MRTRAHLTLDNNAVRLGLRVLTCQERRRDDADLSAGTPDDLSARRPSKRTLTTSMATSSSGNTTGDFFRRSMGSMTRGESFASDAAVPHIPSEEDRAHIWICR